MDLEPDSIQGMLIMDLRIIHDDKGSVLHMLRSDSDNFTKFGEIYFSEIKLNIIKGWKKHHSTIQNFVVPHGKIKLVVFDDRPGSRTENMITEVELGRHEYKMVTIPPKVWYSFKGLSESTALIANLIDSPHHPSESESKEISCGSIPYTW